MKIGTKLLEVAARIIVGALDTDGDGRVELDEVLAQLLPPLVEAIEKAIEKRKARRSQRDA